MTILLLVSGLVLSDLLLLCLGYRLCIAVAERLKREKLAGVALDLATMEGAISGLDQCLETVKDVFEKDVEAPIPSPAPMRPARIGQGAYAIAHNLAKKGASAQALIDDCGLSRGEANMIVQFNQARATRR